MGKIKCVRHYLIKRDRHLLDTHSVQKKKEKWHGALLVNLHSCVTPRLNPLCLGREVVLIISQLHVHMESKSCYKNSYLYFKPEYSIVVMSTRLITMVFFLPLLSYQVSFIISVIPPPLQGPTSILEEMN